MTDAEIKKYTEDQQKAFAEFKDVIDKKLDETAEGKEKLDKIEKTFSDLEKKNQEIMAEREIAKKETADLKEKINLLEKKVYRLPGGGGEHKKSEIVKAFESFVVKGRDNLNSTEREVLGAHYKAYMRTDVDPQGGFLVPVEWSDEIAKNLTETSELRPYARVKQIGTKSYFHPVRSSLLGSSPTAEGQALIESISNYGGIEIFVKKITSKVVVSTEVLEDSAYNLEAEIRMDNNEEFLRAEGHQFVNGFLVTEMKGFMKNPLVAVRNTGVANDITADSMIDLTGDMKRGYRPMFAYNRRTLARVRKFKDGSGAYLWTPTGTGGLAPGVPNEINGYPYIILPDMPDIGAGLEPVVYADFTKYLIVDRVGIIMLRDPYSESNSDKIKYTTRKRTGADVILHEAFKKLRCAV